MLVSQSNKAGLFVLRVTVVGAQSLTPHIARLHLEAILKTLIGLHLHGIVSGVVEIPQERGRAALGVGNYEVRRKLAVQQQAAADPGNERVIPQKIGEASDIVGEKVRLQLSVLADSL